MTEFVSPDDGVSYGLNYPYRYKQDGSSFVVFSTYDGWIWRRFGVGGERCGGLLAEHRAARFCRAVNGLFGHDPAVNAAHDMEV